MKPKVLFTDGEGPIVFKDLAADVADSVVPDLFHTLSLYDDYLAEIGREGYQAGDTLALVVPTLIAHEVTDEMVAKEAMTATLCKGVKEYISGLKQDNWDVRIISTAYSQLWELVGKHIGIPMDEIACTNLDLGRLREQFGSKEFITTVKDVERYILELDPLRKAAADEVDKGRGIVDVFEDPKFTDLREGLDGFYWGMLPNELGFKTLEETTVVGGRRKVEAGLRFAHDLGVELSDIAYVGDSITDDAMHERLNMEGGLPIAINGNGYALRYARVGVATEDMRNLRPILDEWQQGGWHGVQRRVNEKNMSFTPSKEGAPRHEQQPGAHYDLIDPTNAEEFDRVVALHKGYRARVRGKAAKLG